MSRTMTATENNFEVIPTGEYLAQVTDIEDKEGNFGPQYQMIFEIVSPKAFAGKQKYAWPSRKLSGGSKPSNLWKIVQALYNRALVPGEVVDIDDLMGRQCIIVIVAEENDKGEENSKITGYKAYKKQEPFPASAVAQKPTGAAPAEEDDEDPFGDQ